MKQYKCISVSQAKGLFPGPSQPQVQEEDLETILNKDFAWNMYNAWIYIFFQIRMSNNNAVSLIREILHSTLLYTYSTWFFFFSLIIIHPDRVQQKCWKTKKTGSQSPVPPVALAHGIGAQISAVWATRLCPQAPVNTNTGKLSKHGVTGLEKSPVRLRDK